MDYNTFRLIDQVYENIDIEINDKKIISDHENKTIKEAIYSDPKNKIKEKKQIKTDNLYKIKYAKEIQLIKNRFINN